MVIIPVLTNPKAVTEDMIQEPFHDMVLTYRFYQELDDHAVSRAVTVQDAESFGLMPDELIASAYEPEPTISRHANMLIISNEMELFGASVITYTDILPKLAEKLDDDLLIIPSSTHELLAFPLSDMHNVDSMRDVIAEGNSSLEKDWEIISTHSYVFDKDSKELISLTEPGTICDTCIIGAQNKCPHSDGRHYDNWGEGIGMPGYCPQKPQDDLPF